MDETTLLQYVSNIGVPAAITFYLLIKVNANLDRINTSMVRLATRIDNINTERIKLLIHAYAMNYGKHPPASNPTTSAYSTGQNTLYSTK